MRLDKKWSCLVIMLILFIAILVFLLFSNWNKRDLSDNTLQNTEGSIIGTEGNVSRIPKLEEGVNVYEMENEIFSILGTENVMISTDRSSGSGILWDISEERLLVVTSSHLLENFESGVIELWNAEKLEFKQSDVIKDKVHDISVIQIILDKKTYEELLKAGYEGVFGYTVGDRNMPEIGDKMWIIDSIYGAASGISTAQTASVQIFLEDYNAEMLLLYGEGEAGMSGCPVYDEDGYLAGMVSGMSEDKSTLAAVPADAIVKFLETFS